jgi:hypothetical protein
VSGGLSYATSGQPLTVAGFAEATTGGALVGGATGGVTGGVLTKVSGSACFVAGTQVLLADGTSKAIEDIAVGDQVLAADPETGETVAKPVVDTYVHHDVDTYRVKTSTGSVTSTAEHPFWVDGKGWTPVRELVSGDKLVDADGVRVELISVTPTGETETVHNVHVSDLHNYHVQAGDHWVLVHNKCTVPRDPSTGRFTTGAGGESAATATGRSAHVNYENTLGGGNYEFNRALPGSQLRPDAVDFQNRVIRELKPDTPSGHSRGPRQVAGYVEHVENYYNEPGQWTGVVDYYNP